MISTSGILWNETGELPTRTKVPPLRFLRVGMTRFYGALTTARNRMGLPVGMERQFRRAYSATAAFATARTEDKKLRKELCLLGGPCFEGTLRIFNAFRMKSRGRDD